MLTNKISIECLISGKTLVPYYIPKQIKIKCFPKKTCQQKCIVYENNILNIDYQNPYFIKLIGISDYLLEKMIKQMFNIPCAKISYEILDAYTVEELFIIPIESGQYLPSRTAYTIKEGIQCNAVYRIESYTIAEPKHQKLVYVITDYSVLKSHIDNFKLTDNIKKQLEIFRPEANTVESIYEKLTEIYNIYARNITKIYNRFDLHMAIDLAFHSPLLFYFSNELIKGWADIMVIGDTRCGKGSVSQNLCNYYGLGEVVSGENITVSGLIGGVQKLENKWIVTWGKIPLNDRQLVIIDEAGEISDKIFAKLSRIRSEGIAEITKIQSEKSQARTRLIFLTNPKGRNISSYKYGIESVSDIIPNPEDIARFDYILVISNEEVSIEDINKKYPIVDNPYGKGDPALVLWTWNLLPEKIIFTPDAEKYIYNLSVKMGKIYSSEIPIIQGENIRIKLAKISAMISARLYNTDNKGNLLIEKPYVESAYYFLNMIYKKKYSAYYQFSKEKKIFIEPKENKKIEAIFKSFEYRYELMEFLYSRDYIQLYDMMRYFNITKRKAIEIIVRLHKNKCLEKKFNFYVKSVGFTEWLKRNMKEISI